MFLLLLTMGGPALGAPIFYEDDPIQVEPNSQDASGVEPWTIDLVYDLSENMFYRPRQKIEDVRAQNINTVDEVPDSGWFTNRIGTLSLSPEQVAQGPDTTSGPAPGTWRVVAAKNDGITPGFTIEDSNNVRWFIKFDPPGYRAMATGTEVAVTKLFWALGYNVPENYIAKLRMEDLVIAEGTRIKTPSQKKRDMKQSDIRKMLKRASKDPDGSYRVIASKALDGKPLGGFRFYDTRPDDPNDIVPHEHRRELRAYRVFAAWVNHVDSKAINTLDTLITENDQSYVRHHLIDFGSTLGSGAIHPREYWEGNEYLFEGESQIWKDLIRFGFHLEPYRTMPFYESRTIGRMRLDNTTWDPDAWRPRAPTFAFLHARADDDFWAARKVMAFTDEMIRAAIQTGQFADPEGEKFLVKALSERRDAIGKKYLTQINPVVDPVLSTSGTLSFENAAVAAGFAQEPESYRSVWHVLDNESGETTLIGETTSSGKEFQAPGTLPDTLDTYIKIEITASHPQFHSWAIPVHLYFRKTADSWKLVGLQRM